jgi:hypothetical protein
MVARLGRTSPRGLLQTIFATTFVILGYQANLAILDGCQQFSIGDEIETARFKIFAVVQRAQ